MFRLIVSFVCDVNNQKTCISDFHLSLLYASLLSDSSLCMNQSGIGFLFVI